MDSIDTGTADVRAAILTAAETCFTRFGIAKTTMEDVARAAELSRATVYRYFADRESLIVESIARRARMNMGPARAFIAQWPTVADRLVEGICQDIRKGHLDPMVNRLVSPGAMGLATRLLHQSGRALELTRELWEPILAEEQQAGRLRADLDLRLLCEWIAELEILYVSQYGSDETTLDRVRAKLRAFVVPALLP
ncbi:TetR/AcrR family transcriptional regulator [Nocardia sp. alder85J]|uniref:TetR/AcrR family transcriptional regulator n=1 Tax=Nocardia sp. alder85J TaxID=2862949 RepID=UPI001CD2185C|nr:TetR/AcrR family transcriptional regulator [Nocardia sp. alder85J]MCX4098461.1 helix-turn-helix domain containing protein [Nocardia sp. alder85J]